MTCYLLNRLPIQILRHQSPFEDNETNSNRRASDVSSWAIHRTKKDTRVITPTPREYTLQGMSSSKKLLATLMPKTGRTWTISYCKEHTSTLIPTNSYQRLGGQQSSPVPCASRLDFHDVPSPSPSSSPQAPINDHPINGDSPQVSLDLDIFPPVSWSSNPAGIPSSSDVHDPTSFLPDGDLNTQSQRKQLTLPTLAMDQQHQSQSQSQRDHLSPVFEVVDASINPSDQSSPPPLRRGSLIANQLENFGLCQKSSRQCGSSD
ncbi:PREDICTED: uncharacterized protein LOC104807063 isoform X2 [Tarenaya hassleriana]|uniref:uncharacterized protein LOC104807063 isoform X2 n=1 Tax=Tarenaya hassleriana TaxID=28532 RepID=UPI00053C9245|nr:PREDICTED: uncharacterized protein LOC104807063 isoform X2 [Tarenaya hassleriana]